MNTFDIAEIVLNTFATTGECYGDKCCYCIYKTRCNSIATAFYMVLGGEY